MQIKASEFAELNIKEMKNEMSLIIFVNWYYREKPRLHKSGYFWNCIYIHFSHESAFRLVFRPRAKPVNPHTETLGWFTNRTRTSIDDGKARGKDWTRPPVLNLLLCHWSSQLFVNWRSRSIAKSAYYLFETALRSGLRPRLYESR